MIEVPYYNQKNDDIHMYACFFTYYASLLVIYWNFVVWTLHTLRLSLFETLIVRLDRQYNN